MIGAAFAGYSIVYSSMSYWALTVITNLLTVIPNGDEIARIVWGAYSVDEPTLRRFFCNTLSTSFHYFGSCCGACNTIT